MDTYSHVVPTMRAGTAARVDRLLGTRPDPMESEPEQAERAEARVADLTDHR
jgi:hypothetical protein